MPNSSRTFEPPFTDVPGALAEIRAGRMVVVVDDEDRENEGDLTLAAEHVTPEAINFMARFGRGLICLTLTEERADHLRLFPMTQQNSSRFGTAFTETIEAREGVTTGISAADRAHTIRTAIDARSSYTDLARPGHVFPLRARKGGVLVRAGQTEASVDLARLAGLNPSGVICEIMRDDGEMARIPDLIPFCKEHGLTILTVAELIRYRLRHERYIVRAGESRIQTRYGEFRMIAYESAVNGGESHIALVRGELCPDCPAMHLGSALMADSPVPKREGPPAVGRTLAGSSHLVGSSPVPKSEGPPAVGRTLAGGSHLVGSSPVPKSEGPPAVGRTLAGSSHLVGSSPVPKREGPPAVGRTLAGGSHLVGSSPVPKSEGPGAPTVEGDGAVTEMRAPCSHAVLVRVHTRCTAGDMFAADCHCRETLDQSMRMIAEEGCGVVLYLHNTSRGFEIERTPAPAEAFEPGGAAAVHEAGEAETGRLILHRELREREGSQARTGRILRAIGLGGQILSDLGIQRIRLLSNTPMHIPALEGFGLEIVEQVPIPVEECSRVG